MALAKSLAAKSIDAAFFTLYREGSISILTVIYEVSQSKSMR
jgi:hypothetical protein